MFSVVVKGYSFGVGAMLRSQLPGIAAKLVEDDEEVWVVFGVGVGVVVGLGVGVGVAVGFGVDVGAEDWVGVDV